MVGFFDTYVIAQVSIPREVQSDAVKFNSSFYDSTNNAGNIATTTGFTLSVLTQSKSSDKNLARNELFEYYMFLAGTYNILY